MQKRAANHYFNFTRKERNGTIFLLFIIGVLISVPFIYSFIFKEKHTVANNFQEELLSLKTMQQDSLKKFPAKNFDEAERRYAQPSEKNYYSNTNPGTLFNFDPNTLSADGWKKLGVKEKTIATIQNYLFKGGKFRKPEDIQKIWGLRADQVNRLIPYVDIKETTTESATPVKQEYKTPVYERKISAVTVDINLSDTTAWIALPGIGSKLSNRIINFRDKLGGFYNIDQVAETFGLPDSVFQKIRSRLVLTNKDIKQVNINTATLDEMKQHPYIRYNLANLIIQYRSQHGNFLTVTDIKKIMTVTEEQYNKLSPYLNVQ